jgi:hypothetical protein
MPYPEPMPCPEPMPPPYRPGPGAVAVTDGLANGPTPASAGAVTTSPPRPSALAATRIVARRVVVLIASSFIDPADAPTVTPRCAGRMEPMWRTHGDPRTVSSGVPGAGKSQADLP